MPEDRVDASERREAQQTDKRRGIVFGAAVGDALGVPYEFLKRDTFECVGMSEGGVHGKPAGTFSDDTSLLLATCASLKERGDDGSAIGSTRVHTRLMGAPSTLETPRRPPSSAAAAVTGSAPTATGPSCASPRSSSCMHRMTRCAPYRR